jgi:hypothetical protein
MTSVVDSIAEGSTISSLAGVFVLLTALAWLASPGVSVALAYYGASLVSGSLYRLSRSSTSRLRCSLGVLGLVFTWLIALVFSALVLPSNFSVAVI